ncbi:DNA helicase/exodeoxyribonuclease V, subunit B [Faunimonas pinastri]|uniref:DNA helicase/exodeoxyribonuclease V, subunit B n=1 Tax=Faunimonas pinastri TaxID=1855383 RepID=A0A1H9GJM9_9HYPH|nr:double-strand break repair protein AddB [Faunimonas pinastri]SEQ50249.1 DNA helicase/exodeoxyribonuclease V, subunit B [Faunimonas pinastri]
MRPSHVFTIPPGAPFLDTLVDAFLGGELIEGFSASADPFALADATIYLPTRRAARAIRESFLKACGKAVLLPTIRTLGDVDEDEFSLDGSLPGALDADGLGLPPAISAMRRQLELSTLVLAWSGATFRQAAGLGDEPPLVQASPADAVRLAAALAQSIDQVGSGGPGWQALEGVLDRGELARYWEITLSFLRIATEAWPQHLREQGLIDPGIRRDRLVRAEAERLAAHPPRGPVIAAGSTGSVAATAALLAAIARLPNGAVVLPGLDTDLDAPSFEAIGAEAEGPAGLGHPQYGLKLLLEKLEVPRHEVRSLGEVAPAMALRTRTVSEAMRPADTTELWTQKPLSPADRAEALGGLRLVEAASEREEALAVALILRGSLEIPGQVAALVTPDRGLARRVAVELRRWDIRVDDSGGIPFARTRPGVLARLVADVALGGCRAETLLALLRHPLTTLGLAAPETRAAARALERAVLRGPQLKPGLDALAHALSVRSDVRAAQEDGSGTERLGPAASGLSGADWNAAADLVERLRGALAPLEVLRDADGPVPLEALVAAHCEALEAVAADAGGQADALFAGEAGEVLRHTLEELQAAAGHGPDVKPFLYPALFLALLDGLVVRQPGGTDPRIHIWGALEARLQRVDVMVLSGLNEGTWPSQTRLDPLLSRPMRAALELEPPERRVGLAAHDFAQALGQKEVWLTRSDRENGEPRVASRWLQRLLALAGEGLAKDLGQRGEPILAAARAIDAPRAAVAPTERPNPRPPLALRPKSLSATQIETLIRDPYAIYARHVLKLRPFEDLARLPDASERGTLIHDILQAFVEERPAGPFDDAARDRLLDLGRAAFAKFTDFPEIATLWWPRFEKIAGWFVAREAERVDIEERLLERSGVLQVTPEFRLTARADRVDRLVGGGLGIVDYKTGNPPSVDEVLTLSPQLPLEALIAEAGGFEGLDDPGEVERLDYYRLSGQGEGGEIAERGARKAGRDKPEVTLRETIERTGERLRQLAGEYGREETGYLSRKIPRPGREFAGDYDHLARVQEWTLEGEE